ncbi:YgaP family membrane protein [Sporosalibacterium faouarense]|uniref:YgaP family membrane protein n=1 Tax=Sporosalibacterium faouarense TaxID=516123 RepID=UPI00141CD787|nr:DUF2892 domain-containing protein [Sporosalibacterium faouarense]MTI47010.1 DUF2892 domain-containing protein [Bacillota bacterium]
MKENVGKLDSYLRITGGLTMLGIGISRDSGALITLGAMKVAEGITRFCPVLYLMGKTTNNDETIIDFAKNFSKDFEEDEIIDS